MDKFEEIKSPETVALYARVSTGRQENEATIESQLDEIKSRIKNDNNILPVENIFIDDGWTGELLARPNLDNMRDGAADGRFSTLYAYDRGRVSRVFFHQEVVINELMEKEVKFVSLHDINPTTPDEKFLQSVQGLFHEYEKVKIAERFRRGKLFKARSGVMINGQALYGYRYIKKTDDEPAKYEIYENEADIVRQIFRWVGVDGLSMRGVIKRLYERKIYPRKRKRDSWSRGPIVRLLKCKTYFDGIAYYNKSEAIVAKHPFKDIKYKKVKRTSRRVRTFDEWIPLQVPKLFKDSEISLYNSVQQILIDNKRYASKRRIYDYLLTGKIYCEHGFRRVGDGYSKGSNHYYRSAARIYKFPEKTECDCSGVNAVILDKLFWDELYKILTNPIILKDKAEKWFKHISDYSLTNDGEIESVNRKIEALRDEGTCYAKMRGEGQIDDGQFKSLMKDVLMKKKRYQEQILEIKSRANPNKLENININDLCEEAQRVIKSQDTDNKKQIIRDLVEKVIIKKGGDEVETWIHIQLTQAHQMGYGNEHRNRWFTKCRKINTF